jgi:hypothetical protein
MNRSLKLEAPQFYTVSSVVYFLRNLDLAESDYGAYLERAVSAGVDFVRIKDCKNLADYLRGDAVSVPQMSREDGIRQILTKSKFVEY